jgi:pimeloyl-ACP methyl ester carboxylesterase
MVQNDMATKNILFIHGLFVTFRCWDQWVSRFQTKWYNCQALPWPGRDKPLEVLRKNPSDAVLSRLTLDEVVDLHDKTIHSMAEPPILIGHSMGGLITQVLLNRGLGAAGVAIDSAPPQGVLTARWSFLKSNWPLLNPLIPSSTPYVMSLKEFQYMFVNGFPLPEQMEAYEKTVVPESRRVARGALGSVARIDFKKPHAPLLMIAGSADNIIPASLNKTNYERYKASPSVTDFKEFPGRTHYTLGQKGWEEVADYVLDWIGQRRAR